MLCRKNTCTVKKPEVDKNQNKKVVAIKNTHCKKPEKEKRDRYQAFWQKHLDICKKAMAGKREKAKRKKKEVIKIRTGKNRIPKSGLKSHSGSAVKSE